MKKIIALAALVVLFASCEFNFDAGPRFVAAEFVPVEDITGIPTGSLPYIATILAGTVMPENATYKRIEWSITEDSGTNSTLNETRLTANEEGTVTVTATIKNGLAEGVDYTQDFPILIALAENTVAVKSISGVPAILTVGEYTLKGRVVPDRAINITIDWSVKDAGTTGATIADNTLTTTARGTVVLTATVANGRLTSDYTEDFSINISKTVVAAGYYQPARSGSQPDIRPCYWIDGELFDLEIPYTTPGYGKGAYTSGIVYAGDTQYIAGYYFESVGTPSYTPCYWVNGVLKTLPATANNATRTYSIAADTDGTVYIYGNSAGTRCLWKIVNGEVVGSAVTLTPPATLYGNTPPFEFFAVNNGNVYIPFSTGTNLSNKTHYYWYWDGTATAGTVVQISAFDTTVNNITSIAAIGGSVYIAGHKYDSVAEKIYPLYWRVGDAAYTLLELPENRGTIDSIVEQNGELWFYGVGQRKECYWDGAGNYNDMPWISHSFVSNKVVYSEGDVYIVINSISRSNSDGYENDLGWMVGVGGQLRYFEGYQFYIIRATGIAVPGN
jgi:hypothetical protein